MGKIRGAIQRIDIPLVFASSFDPRSLFSHHIVTRKLLLDPFENQSFRLSIGHCDQIHRALIFDLHMLAKVAHHQAPRFTSHSLHRRNQVQRCHREI